MANRMNEIELFKFELRVADLFNTGKIRAPVHLDGGNELALIRIFERVDSQDWVLGHWRMHYKCLLKGVAPERLLDDIVAGRSISLCYPDHRILSTAIVGGVLPIAVGIAAAIKSRGGFERVWCFLGDMTARTGLYHECHEYARCHGLPVTWVIEDNGRSVCTPTEETWEDGSLESARVERFAYTPGWPHAGAGVRVEF